MSTPLEIPEDEIAELCETYGVERLELFGSGARGDFNENPSDLDFIVRFADRSPGYADRYLDFAWALESLFEQEVDLVTERSIQNPYFRRSLDDARQVIYDRRSEETPA